MGKGIDGEPRRDVGDCDIEQLRKRETTGGDEAFVMIKETFGATVGEDPSEHHRQETKVRKFRKLELYRKGGKKMSLPSLWMFNALF